MVREVIVENMSTYSWIIPLLPFLAFMLVLFGGRKLPGKGAYISIGAVVLSFFLSLFVLAEVGSGKTVNLEVIWFNLGQVKISVGILIDQLSAVMLVVVTLVSLMVQIYSIGYIHGESRFSWYFSALSLFTAAMLSLVIAHNFLQLYISWELVGLCSYLLIGFWYEKKSASNAAMKAFITTRVGDVGFFLGIALLFYVTTQLGKSTFEFYALRELVEGEKIGSSVLTAIALFLFCGAVGKSAQFPLHTWLPDAMEGPTPVSALIHAATMVAAGVYLVGRSFFIFQAASPLALNIVAIIGALTALMAATIAVTMSDIKKVLAYSTISQLGYMMTALGIGAYAAGLFHLMTHAFFKALLFLGAGSVIHGTGSQNIYEMGGLYRKMKITFATFLIAALSLAGIFPFSGFWSKDEILAEAFNKGHFLIFGVLLFSAFLTAFYIFKLCFLVFWGRLKSFHIHPHESPPIMSYPMIILALPAAFAGIIGSPLFKGAFINFLEGTSVELHVNYSLMLISLLVSLLGIGLAWAFYYKGWFSEEKMKEKASFLYRVIENKYYFDELYQALFVNSILKLAFAFSWGERKLIDRVVNGVGGFAVVCSEEAARFDKRIIDAVVNGIGKLIREIGERGRRAHGGYLQRYAFIIYMGFIVLALVVYLLRR